MMLERALAVACVATLLVGGTLVPDATAQVAGESDFATSDLNDDGVIDREEYHRRMMDVMLLADADKDGTLSTSELPAADPAAFAGADSDGDGMLSTDEFVDARFEDFDAADQDGSGTLSAPEVDAWR
jgi:Ca2+-binding EF-hand superfamily protein